MSANLGNAIVCVVAIVILFDFILSGGDGYREGKITLITGLSIMHVCVIYGDGNTVPCLECNEPFQGRKASASQNSLFHFYQEMFSGHGGLLRVPPPVFQKKRMRNRHYLQRTNGLY